MEGAGGKEKDAAEVENGEEEEKSQVVKEQQTVIQSGQGQIRNNSINIEHV